MEILGCSLEKLWNELEFFSIDINVIIATYPDFHY